MWMFGPATARGRFHARLAVRPVLADGGMGTLLFSRGISVRACLDELVVKRPDLVASLHREYLEAGADLIETLTFGANRIRLDGYGLAAQVHAFNRRAAQLAREARDVTGRDALVAASIGPLVAPAHDVDRPAAHLVRDVFEEQVEGLLEGGVDLFVVETFGDLDHLLIAIDTIRAACDLPVVGEMTFGEELVAVDGTTPARAASVLSEAGVDALGVNCGVGPLACLDALGHMGPSTPEVGRSIMPNAGLPQRVEGRFVYAAEPAYFGEMVPRMLEAGAAIIGGCCGTTPDHVAAMRAALDTGGTVGSASSRDGSGETRRSPRPAASGPTVGVDGREPSATAATDIAPRTTPVERPDRSVGEAPSPTGLAEALAARRYVISVEIDPPRSIRIDRTLEAARQLHQA